LVALTLVASAASAGAQVVPIPGLFNSGVDPLGVKLAVGNTDPHYTVLENAGAQAIVTNNGAYVQVPTAAYIWETASGNPGSVNRTFRTTFDLTGLDPLTAILSGSWSTDNAGLDILINGVSTGISKVGFGAFTPFSINSGFVAGLNTLDFVVQDQGAPGAFAVNDLAGTASVIGAVIPEPSTVALLGGGLLGLAGFARRRRTA
jgi:hypothetical protein